MTSLCPHMDKHTIQWHAHFIVVSLPRHCNISLHIPSVILIDVAVRLPAQWAKVIVLENNLDFPPLSWFGLGLRALTRRCYGARRLWTLGLKAWARRLCRCKRAPVPLACRLDPSCSWLRLSASRWERRNLQGRQQIGGLLGSSSVGRVNQSVLRSGLRQGKLKGTLETMLTKMKGSGLLRCLNSVL